MALHHARAGEIVDLKPLGKDLPNSRTTAIVKSEAFEAIRLVIPAGKELPAHEVAGDITLHCLEGRVTLSLGNTAIALSAGEWIYLQGGANHAVKATEDSSLLLTILFDR